MPPELSSEDDESSENELDELDESDELECVEGGFEFFVDLTLEMSSWLSSSPLSGSLW